MRELSSLVAFAASVALVAFPLNAPFTVPTVISPNELRDTIEDLSVITGRSEVGARFLKVQEFNALACAKS